VTSPATPTFINESEVEQRFLYPLLWSPPLLDIPQDAIKPKQYLAPTVLDKAAGKSTGYYPDYSIWMHGAALMIIEAKDPQVASEVGFREARIYATHLNARYPSGQNPAKYVLATNGSTFLAGLWDQEAPVLTFQVGDLTVQAFSTPSEGHVLPGREVHHRRDQERCRDIRAGSGGVA
jgi:type I site-specific restriction endonuclease